jgi:hypothetical protein
MNRLRQLRICTTDSSSAPSLAELKSLWKIDLNQLRVIHVKLPTSTSKSDPWCQQGNREEAYPTEAMRQPFCAISSAIKNRTSGSISKLLISTSANNLRLAAHFTNEDEKLSPEALIRMTKADKHSVNYETVLDRE